MAGSGESVTQSEKFVQGPSGSFLFGVQRVRVLVGGGIASEFVESLSRNLRKTDLGGGDFIDASCLRISNSSRF